MYCTYKVRTNSFNEKLGYYRLLFWVITMYSRPVNNKLLPLEVTMSSYHKCYAKNRSHKLTADFLVYCTYKVRQGLPTLEAMNWRHCIPRVGVHYIESTLCPTVADWSLSDHRPLVPVPPLPDRSWTGWAPLWPASTAWPPGSSRWRGSSSWPGLGQPTSTHRCRLLPDQP